MLFPAVGHDLTVVGRDVSLRLLADVGRPCSLWARNIRQHFTTGRITEKRKGIVPRRNALSVAPIRPLLYKSIRQTWLIAHGNLDLGLTNRRHKKTVCYEMLQGLGLKRIMRNDLREEKE
jgi:hypothetical protein